MFNAAFQCRGRNSACSHKSKPSFHWKIENQGHALRRAGDSPHRAIINGPGQRGHAETPKCPSTSSLSFLQKVTWILPSPMCFKKKILIFLFFRNVKDLYCNWECFHNTAWSQLSAITSCITWSTKITWDSVKRTQDKLSPQAEVPLIHNRGSQVQCVGGGGRSGPEGACQWPGGLSALY